MRKFLSVLLALVMLCTLILTGCHGSKETVSFEIPEEFDTSRQYEITFWAKNDTNITQTRIYEKAIADLDVVEYDPFDSTRPKGAKLRAVEISFSQDNNPHMNLYSRDGFNTITEST